MDTERKCEQCGQAMPENTPEGLCPSCLARVALGSEATENPAATISIGPEAFVRVRYFGDYELQEEIARGGMGVVYRARQLSLKRPVAVKMILAGQLASEADVKRFHIEAEAAANLQHPNIVAIHEIGQHEGQHFYSMDFIDGSSLAARLKAGALTVGEATRLAKIMAEAVHYAHQHGVIHRDLKPANVLLDTAGQPRLTDFGLAKRLDRDQRLTGSGAVFGTPSYMPPEQAAGRQDLVGPASDTYALGAMLYEMLTGQPPFRGATAAETISQAIEATPTPPSRLNPRVPRDLETICLKCLEKRRDLRYGTADLLAKDLDRFLNHEPIRARPLGTGRKVYRWVAQRPWILAALGTVAVLGLVWTALGLWTENQLLTWEAHPVGETPPIIPWLRYTPFSGFLVAPWWFLLPLLNRLLRNRTRRRIVTGHFVSQRVLLAFGLAGLVGIACGVYYGAAVIEQWKWAQHALPRLRSAFVAGHKAMADSYFAQQQLEQVEATALNTTSVLANLFFAATIVWAGGGLIIRARREHNFVLYNSADEEEIARYVAQAADRGEEAQREMQRATGTWEMILTPLGAIIYWCLFLWCVFRAIDQPELSGKCVFAGLSGWAGGISAWALRSSRLPVRRTGQVLLIASVLFAVAAIVARPASSILIEVLIGAAFGACLGCYIRWKSQWKSRMNRVSRGS